MPDFQFLADFRNVAIPAPNMDGVILTSNLEPGIAENAIPAEAAEQLRQFWRFTAGGPLLVDQEYGICGLVLHDPAQSKQSSRDRADSGYEIMENDWVLGEFIGDTDMLVIDAQGSVLVSAGSYPRNDWYRFESLTDLLMQYTQGHAEKFWERTNR